MTTNASKGATNLEEAFIAYMQEANETPISRHALAPGSGLEAAANSQRLSDSHRQSDNSLLNFRRLFAYSYCETLEITRDPVRLAFAFIGSMALLFVFGFGITMDVNKIEFAVLDYDQSPESQDYVDSLVGSNYFVQRGRLYSQEDMERRLKENSITLALEIPPDFGRELKRGGRPTVSTWIDGANPSRASTIEGYVQGVHTPMIAERAREAGQLSSLTPRVMVEQRFRYNPTFESIDAMVPAVPSILLILIPAILMTVSVVKEKELGSITNFYVTLTSRLEFLLGKQLPYIGVGLANFFILTLMAVFLFDVPLKGNGSMLVACAAAYVTAVTGIGLLVFAFTSSQVAAVFVTTIVTILPTVQFSGLMQPVSTLEGGARLMGTFWPTTYYMHAGVGAFTKGLTAREMLPDLLALLAFIPVLTLLTALTLRKQEQ